MKEFIPHVWEALPHIILGIDRHEIEESVSKGWPEFVHQGFLHSESGKEGVKGGLSGGAAENVQSGSKVCPRPSESEGTPYNLSYFVDEETIPR